MKSVKPGRGPSMMGAAGSIAIAVFGIIWTIGAIQIGGGILFALFGLCFVGIAVVQAIYHFTNATSENRYSEFDIVDASEEEDPLNRRFGGKEASLVNEEQADWDSGAMHYCPYCGKELKGDFSFCPSCGKELPK